MTSTSKTKPAPHEVGEKAAAVRKPARRIARPTGEESGAAERDDQPVSAALERDFDSTDATQLEAIFEEPRHVDDGAILYDARSTGSRRR